MLKQIIVNTVLLISLSSFLNAGSIKTKSELNYMNSTGNSDVASGAVLFDLSKEYKKHTIKGHYEWFYSEENGIENKNKMLGNINYLYAISSHLNFDYILQVEKDKFSGFDYKAFTGPGIKYNVYLKSSPKIFDIGANIVAETNELSNGNTDNFISLLISQKYQWKVTDSLLIKQNLTYRVDLGNTSTFNIASNFGFENKLNKMFSLGMNYKIDYNNNVLPGIVKTDKILTASFIINY